MKRTYTEVGAKYSAPGTMRRFLEAEIKKLAWEPLADQMNLPAMQGMGIAEAIKQLRIPKVSKIAWNGVIAGRYGLYGIEGTYTNGRARIYVLDRGSDLLPLASEIEEKEAS